MEDVERVKNIVEFIRLKVTKKPTIGLVAGSGAGCLAELFKDKITIPFNAIPTFPISSVAGHQGNLIFGELNGKYCVLLQGRVHLYEGIGVKEITLYVRVLKYLGIEALFLTNASGSLRKEYKVGDFCIVKDHINMPALSGMSPLVGPNIDEYGTRFPSMSGAYDKKLRQLARNVAKEMNINEQVHDSVYFCQGGPSYETPAELKFFQIAGCDLIGMSTAHEVITARHMNIRCFCLSLVSNQCILDCDEDNNPNHEEVLQAGRDKSEDLKNFLALMVKHYS